MKIVLSWPDKRLSPNARVHFYTKHSLNKAAKESAGWETVAAPGYADFCESIPTLPEMIPVKVMFIPPDNRRRDLDNQIASLKGHFDGIAGCLGIDDSRFQTQYAFGPAEKPGRVVIEL